MSRPFRLFPRPTLLARTLIRGNLMLILPALLLGVGLYLLTDLFERLDNFIEAEVGAGTVLAYFAYKTPSIISQLLPVVFLLAVVIQLCLMARDRELTAIQTGGISLFHPAKILFCCGIAAAAMQLCFSEVLGVIGDRESSLIWQDDVHKRNFQKVTLKNLWFRDGQYIVHLGTLNHRNRGTAFTSYRLAANNIAIDEIIRGKRFTGRSGAWTVHDATVTQPRLFMTAEQKKLTVPLTQDPRTFRMFTTVTTPSQLPIWQLNTLIGHLSAAGSNVEHLKTAWHNKLSYACSLIVMALVGVALVSFTSNIYLATVLSLLCTFLYYMLFTVFTSIGEKGAMPPALAAWMADIIGLAGAGVRLVPLFIGHRK